MNKSDQKKAKKPTDASSSAKLPYSDLSTEQRLELAKKKTEKTVEHVLNLIALHESNQIVVYSPTLAKQIPQSYAANAFNMFQRTVHSFELIRLCALWDGNDPAKENIPTIVNLIDSEDVLKALEAETSSHWKNIGWRDLNPNPDPELRAAIHASVNAHNTAFGVKQGKKVLRGLRSAVKETKLILTSDELSALMNYRDKHLAHSLTETRREKKGVVRPPKFGEERELLKKSIRIINKLYLGINGRGFQWDDSRRISKRNAKALWEGCQINVKA